MTRAPPLEMGVIAKFPKCKCHCTKCSNGVRSSLFIQKLSKKPSFQILAFKDTSVQRQPLRCGHEYFALSPAVWSLGYLGGSPQPSLDSYTPSLFCMERNI